MDYDYDQNGNLTKDLNKDIDLSTGAIQGIQYNHLNLPWKINVKNKGTITYIYDAAGNKLEKKTADITTPSAGAPSGNKITSYASGFVYENNLLQFFGHEEGRVRVIPPPVSGASSFVYDYFIKDHLGNVRMVLTDEVKPAAIYKASMEDALNGTEVQLFDKITETRSAKPPGFEATPNSENQKVIKLFSSSTEDKRTGPGVILKVMSGDKFKARVLGWYQPGNTDAAQQTGLVNIANLIINSLSGGIAGIGKAAAGEILSSNVLDAPINAFLPTQSSPQAGVPKAYLNWMVLDEEQFKLVTGNYGATPIPAITGTMDRQVMQSNNGNDITISKNGYLYVYVSNESKGNVYFDDLIVEHTAGALLEETHYYPFGLTMAGISCKAAGGLENKYNYNKGSELQSKEFSDGSGLEMYDTHFRQLDPQLGRWWQIDPKPDYAESPYSAMKNNPISFNDPLGDSVPHILKTIGNWLVGQTIIGTTINTTNTIKAVANGDKDAALSLVSFTGSKLNEGVKTFSTGSSQQKQDYATTLLLDLGLGFLATKLPANANVKSGFGDLTQAEVASIQKVVNEGGRPLEVVGSAATGTRRGVGSNNPIGKGAGTRSDIDYVAPPSSIPYINQSGLPSIDPKTGVIPGYANPFQSPFIRFEPNSKPTFSPKEE